MTPPTTYILFAPTSFVPFNRFTAIRPSGRSLSHRHKRPSVQPLWKPECTALNDRASNSAQQSLYTTDVQEIVRHGSSEWGTVLNIPSEQQPIKILNRNPLLLLLPSLIDSAEAHAIIDAQSSNTDEASLYLNYRVNAELSTDSQSVEAASLIEDTQISQKALRADMRSGFRTQVPFQSDVLQPVLQKVADALGFKTAQRQWVYNDGLWVRPNKRQVVLRDVTTVHYRVNEGVAPHIDGKDVTVLIGLKPAIKGGRTMFIDENIAVRLNVGDALVYSSKNQLLHFAEAVEAGEKWVLQLLIDCRVRQDELDVSYETGAVLS